VQGTELPFWIFADPGPRFKFSAGYKFWVDPEVEFGDSRQRAVTSRRVGIHFPPSLLMDLTLADYGFSSVRDKVVLISGASSGIGRASAMLLTRAGACLVVMARSEQRLVALAAEIAGLGYAEPTIVVGDVRDENACKGAVERCLERFGRVDVLVNNAAVGFPVDIGSCSTEEYQRTMQTNIDGAFYLTRATLAPMREQQSGHIVMISSDAGSHGSGVAPIYSVSKHALEGFTASLREQLEGWRKQGVYIRLTNVWPGTVASDYWGERDVPRHTFMTCDEMAKFILQVIACQTMANVTDIRVQQFKHGAAADKAAADWFEKHKR